MAWMWGVSGMMLAPPVGWTRRGHVWFDWDFLDDFQLLVGGGFDLIGLLMWLKPPFCCMMCTNSLKLGGGNSNIFYFYPDFLEKWSNLTSAYFSIGSVQPPTSQSWISFFLNFKGRRFLFVSPKDFLTKLYIKATELGVFQQFADPGSLVFHCQSNLVAEASETFKLENLFGHDMFTKAGVGCYTVAAVGCLFSGVSPLPKIAAGSGFLHFMYLYLLVDKRDIGFNWKILGVLMLCNFFGGETVTCFWLFFWWDCQPTYGKNMAQGVLATPSWQICLWIGFRICFFLPQFDKTCLLWLPSRELTYPPDKAYLKMIFLFPRWDMLISRRVVKIPFFRVLGKEKKPQKLNSSLSCTIGPGLRLVTQPFAKYELVGSPEKSQTPGVWHVGRVQPSDLVDLVAQEGPGAPGAQARSYQDFEELGMV